MAVQFVNQDAEENIPLSLRVGNFFLAHRKIFLAGLLVVFAVVAALVTMTVVTRAGMASAYDRIQDLLTEWHALDPESADAAAAETGILDGLQEVAAENRRNFAGVRANLSLAEIYFAKEDWASAREFYKAAADVPGGFYTEGFALYNAGICAEQMNLPEDAASLFLRAAETESFSQKPRSLFAAARVQEQNGSTQKALETYRRILDLYPSSSWTELAHSRIIALELPAGQ